MLKSELQGLVALGIPKLWKADDSLVLESKFTENLQKISKDVTDVEVLQSSFDEVNLLKFFDSLAKVGVSM